MGKILVSQKARWQRLGSTGEAVHTCTFINNTIHMLFQGKGVQGRLHYGIKKAIIYITKTKSTWQSVYLQYYTHTCIISRNRCSRLVTLWNKESNHIHQQHKTHMTKCYSTKEKSNVLFEEGKSRNKNKTRSKNGKVGCYYFTETLAILILMLLFLILILIPMH